MYMKRFVDLPNYKRNYIISVRCFTVIRICNPSYVCSGIIAVNIRVGYCNTVRIWSICLDLIESISVWIVTNWIISIAVHKVIIRRKVTPISAYTGIRTRYFYFCIVIGIRNGGKKYYFSKYTKSLHYKNMIIYPNEIHIWTCRISSTCIIATIATPYSTCPDSTNRTGNARG